MNDPRQEELQDLVRSCVQCALCLPHCATWLATGNEVNSPRGRLLLLEAVLEDCSTIAPQEYLDAFDGCIGCRACEAMCPSGVPFSLLEYGQQLAGGHGASMVPAALLRRLDSPGVLTGMRLGGDLGRTALQLLAGKNWRQKLEGKPLALGTLARMLGSLPHSPDNDRHLVQLLDELVGATGKASGENQHAGSGLQTPKSPQGPTVAFFHGCASQHLLPGTSGRMRDILTWSGCTLIEPPHQGCCGALADHTGRPGTASAQNRGFQDTFSTVAHKNLPILIEAAGCSHHLKQNPEPWQGSVVDAVVFLAGLDLPPLASIPLKVVYHDPCHALHGQQIKAEPRDLLQQVPGLQLLEPSEAEVCCGSGGTWGLRHHELSAELARRKARNLADTGAQLVVTSNPGCLGQIADGLALEAPNLPILPLSDLLWYALWRK